MRIKYIAAKSILPKLHGLLYTHKDTNAEQLKVRPIVNGRGGPAFKLSWLLSRLLTPLLNDVAAHLPSSYELLQEIVSTDSTLLQAFPFPVSLDV